MNFSEADITKWQELAITYGLVILKAAAVLLVGLWVINRIVKILRKSLGHRKMDHSLITFLTSMVNITLKLMLGISVIQMLGIETTSFVAVLGAAGLAVGLALSGTLQNFAGGVVLLIFRPFKVGDFIEAQGFTGVVKEIQIFVTIITTVDNKTIIIPNGPLSTGNLVNFSAQDTRRVDFTFSIAYGEDANKAMQVLRQLAEADPRVLKDPAVFVGLVALNNSSVDFALRVWAKTEDYWDVYFDLNQKVYEAMPKAGLSHPFPQMDLHIKKQD
jgi:small conductance mechanosensitive channel